MFKLIARVIFSIWYSIISIIVTAISGKHVSVSPYRFLNEGVDFWELSSEKYNKEDRYTHISDDVKDRIIREYNEHLHYCLSFKKVRGLNFPIFDGEKIIGSKSLMGVINEERERFLNK